MAKKAEEVTDLKIERPARAKLTAEVSLKRMETFEQRKEAFIASVRKGKN